MVITIHQNISAGNYFEPPLMKYDNLNSGTSQFAVLKELKVRPFIELSIISDKSHIAT